ncbi:hypothetical protein B0J11DRAFT_507447 [Dendryphion nanum]|uniref:SET domain-containing protein n=1 Tax=Dendryphion nanum TaxID=256645 RepID=A0A9P9IKE4_9PLEO|nr:hypothetical protein B0J11DRAFT_507447 [Dendryphion nanum]
MSSFEESGRRFLSWLSRTGADISNKIKLEDLRKFNAGRGVVAAQNIEEDELLFRIPRSSILSVENSILSSEIPKVTFEHLGPWLSLILVMLYEHENKASSNWAPYFDVLPSDFNTLMFWEKDELEQLEASAVVHKIGREKADETFLRKLVPVIKEFADIFFSGDANAAQKAEQMAQPQNLQLMHKMGSLIMAYAFDVEPANPPSKVVDEEGYASEDEDEALPKGMVPLADMLNADADRNNARLYYEENHLSMKALTSIEAGSEIFNDYGPLPRSDLLRRYGYITDNYALYDVVEISHDLVLELVKQKAPAGFEQRIDYLDEQGVVDIGYDISASTPFDILESVAPELLVLIRALLLPADEFERLKRKGKLPKSEGFTANDAACLRSIVQARTRQYATSLADDTSDVTMIMDGEATIRERRFTMAKAVRIGEKTILKDADEALEKMVRELESTTNGAGGLKRGAEDGHEDGEKKRKFR